MVVGQLHALRIQLEALYQRGDKDIDAVHANIRVARARGENTRSVLFVRLLKRSIALKKAREGVMSRINIVDLQIEALESSDFNRTMLKTMQNSADTMRKMGLEKGLLQADSAISDLEDNLQTVGEFSSALGAPITETHFNDDELDSELESIMSDPHPSTMPITTTSQLPTARTSTMGTVEVVAPSGTDATMDSTAPTRLPMAAV
jgi:hypothetical protein